MRRIESAYVACESSVAVVVHARQVEASTPIRLSGHASPRPASLCGSAIAWDTQLPLRSVTCRDCRAALEALGLGYPWLRPRASRADQATPSTDASIDAITSIASIDAIASIASIDRTQPVRPDLREAQPMQGPAGRCFEGMIFDSEFRVPYGQVVQATHLTRDDFYPAGIVFEDARDWNVLDVQIEHRSQLLHGGEVRAAEISANPGAHMTRWRACRAAQSICLVVRYVGDDPAGRRFLAAIVGTFSRAPSDPKDPHRSVLRADHLILGDLRGAMRPDARIRSPDAGAP